MKGTCCDILSYTGKRTDILRPVTSGCLPGYGCRYSTSISTPFLNLTRTKPSLQTVILSQSPLKISSVNFVKTPSDDFSCSMKYSVMRALRFMSWLSYVTDLFLPIVDSETGDLKTLPFPGSASDQPYMTMQVIKLIQLNYRKHLADKMKSLKTK